MSTISAGTTTGTALVSTGDTTGALVIRTGASNAVAMTVGADQSVAFAGTVTGIPVGSITATASGSISTGAPVIVNSNGTVSAVTGSSEIIFSGANTADGNDVAYDPVNQRIVVVYVFGGVGWAVVGTVSGTNITYGTPVIFEQGAGNAFTPSISYDSVNQKFVIFYRFNQSGTDFGYAIVGTVSGTSISFGTRVVYNSGSSFNNASVYDVGSGRVLVFYNEGSGDSGGYGRAGTVSGTTISFGSAALLLGGSNTRHLGCGYDVAAARTIVGFCDVNTNRNAAVVIASVSGSTITYGTKTTTNQGNNTVNKFTYDSVSQRMVYGFTSNELRTCVVTISGTTATVNSVTNVASGTVNSFGIAYDPSIQRVLFSYGENSGATGQLKSGTVSGTSITVGSASQFNAGTSSISSAYAANGPSVVIVYQDNANGSLGTSLSVVNGALTNLTATNYIGFSGAAFTNGQTATIQTVGSTNNNQTSLTPGIPYYVTPSGGVSSSAGIPSVIAGTAVSATRLIIKG